MTVAFDLVAEEAFFDIRSEVAFLVLIMRINYKEDRQPKPEMKMTIRALNHYN